MINVAEVQDRLEWEEAELHLSPAQSGKIGIGDKPGSAPAVFGALHKTQLNSLR